MKIVMKFGGSSLKDSGSRTRTARHIAEQRRNGDDVVVVVSAPGNMTNELIAEAKAIHAAPDERCMAQLLAIGEQYSCALVAMELNAQGISAVPMTGWQAGIRTDGKSFVNARIVGIDTMAILAHLNAGRVVVIAGFQGLFIQNGMVRELTVLERGGSDTTAIHLACALDAEECILFKDVAGIATAPPNLIPRVHILDTLSLEELSEMVRGGAEMVSKAAISMLRCNAKLSLFVRPAFSNAPGTVIIFAPQSERVVSSITYRVGVALVTIHWKLKRKHTDTLLLKAFARENINIYLAEGVHLTIREEDDRKAKYLLAREQEELGIRKFEVRAGLAQVTVVGEGMRNRPGVLEQIQEGLEKNNIPWLLRSTSEISASYVVQNKDYQRAIEALHLHFFGSADS